MPSFFFGGGGAMESYKAWIPNVSGRLSFSNIKGAKIPGRAGCPKTINDLSDEVNNQLYSLQKRNLSDTALAPLDRNGQFLYLIAAKIINRWSEDEALKGTIYTFPRPALDVQQSILIKQFNKDFEPKDKIKELISLWECAAEVRRINFVLYRNGLLDIKYPDFDKDAEAEAASIVFEAYSFLKDLVHSHKFHRYDDDAIVVPYPHDTCNDNLWIQKTIRNLHKSVVSTYRNAFHQQDIINALGKLSYLASFQRVVSERFPEISQKHNLNTDALRLSLEYKLESQKDKEIKKSELLQTVLTVILSGFGLMIAMSQLLQIPCIEGLTSTNACVDSDGLPVAFKITKDATNVVQILIENWYQFLMALPGVVITLITITYWQRSVRWLNNIIGHTLVGWWIRTLLAYAVSQGFGRILAYIWIAFIFIIGLLMAYVAMGLWQYGLTQDFNIGT